MTFLSHTYLLPLYLLSALILGSQRIIIEEKKPVRVMRATGLAFALLLGPSQLFASDVVLRVSEGADKPIGNYVPILHENVSLRGSRGEVLSFLLYAENQAAVSRCASLSDQWIKGNTKVKAAFYWMPLVDTRQPSFPGAFVGAQYDPLLPSDGGQVCIPSKGNGWIFGELSIPQDLSPGDYQGQISLGNLASIKTSLKIWKMTMPEVPTLPLYSELTTWFNLLGHFGKWQEGEARLAKSYIEAMQAHRVYPLKASIAVPEVQQKTGTLLLNLNSKPSPDQSFSAVSLSARPAWAYFDFPTVKPEDLHTLATKNYFQAIENSLPEINRPGKALVYLWDEPRVSDFPVLRELSTLVRMAAPSLKIMVTVPYFPELESSVDIFVPVMDQLDAAGFATRSSYRDLRKKGKEVWWYVSCMSHGCNALADSGVPDFVIDRPSVYIKSIPWIADGDIDAFLYYSVNNGYQFYPKRDPWNSLWDFSGNGDGTLFYPGRPGEHGLTQHMPIASLRLKIWREASFDAEYLAWISHVPQIPQWFLSDYAELVQNTRQWSKQYSAYSKLREKIGEYLNQV